jgi:putative hydrolase of the HAD superfamily
MRIAMLPPSVRAVVFDAVGTLIYPNPTAPAVYAAYARRHGVLDDAEIIRTRMIAAYNAEEAIDQAADWVTSEERELERWRRIVAASLPELSDLEACFQDLFEHFSRPDAWTVNRDAATVFAELTKRGCMIGLASNYDTRLLRILAGRPELVPIRKRVIISSLVGWRKPSPRFFQELARTLSLASEEILYVGDDYKNDYMGANAAGFSALLLDERNRYQTTARIPRLIELVS